MVKFIYHITKNHYTFTVLKDNEILGLGCADNLKELFSYYKATRFIFPNVEKINFKKL